MPENSRPITVILVDDHILFRESLKVMISEWQDIQIVGEASGGKECMQIIGQKRPTVAILDITMQGPEGLSLAPKIRRVSPRTEVLILTMHDNRDYVYQAFKNGCRGFLLKSDSVVELQKAVRTVAQSKTYLSPDIATDFIDDLITRVDTRTKSGQSSFLSTREQDVCNFLVLGQSTDDISEQLNISPKTVRVHIANVMRKYNCKTRTELILRLQAIHSK